MALRDSRVFRDKDKKVWVAQVHSQIGTGSAPDLPMEQDGILFSCLTDDSLDTRKINLPVGHLMKLGHEEILQALADSHSLEGRIDLHPYGMADPKEYGENRFTDENGLNWGYKRISEFPGVSVDLDSGSTGIRRDEALEVVCFDDSALRVITYIEYKGLIKAPGDIPPDIVEETARVVAREIYKGKVRVDDY